MGRTPKPIKTLYQNQEEIVRGILENLTENHFLNPFVERVYLLGSLTEGGFGIYDKPYQPIIGGVQYASDVDLIILGNDTHQVPENWTKKDNFIFEFYYICTLYGISGIKEGIHEVSSFLYKPSLENLPPANKFNWEGDVFDMPTRKEALDFWLKNHKNVLWYEK